MLSWAYRNRWRLAAASVVGSVGYVAWKTLRHIPLRELIELVRERERNEISETLRSGDGTTILNAHLQNLRADLNSLQDVASRQASLRVPGLPTSERVAAYLELSAASFTRTLSAVYARSILELFVDVQVLMARQQRSDLGPAHDDEQRRFLSALRSFGLPPVSDGGPDEEGQGRDDSAVGEVTIAPSPLEDLVAAVEHAVRDFMGGRTPGEACDDAWIESMIEHIRVRIEGRAEGDKSRLREGVGSVRSRHEDLTRLLLRLLPAEGCRGGLESRMIEVLQSELWESAVASVLDKGFESVSSQLKAGIPESGSLQMAKLVPIMSNEFGCVAGPGDWGGYQALRVCDGSSCRALFQVVGLGASAN